MTKTEWRKSGITLESYPRKWSMRLQRQISCLHSVTGEKLNLKDNVSTLVRQWHCQTFQKLRCCEFSHFRGCITFYSDCVVVQLHLLKSWHVIALSNSPKDAFTCICVVPTRPVALFFFHVWHNKDILQVLYSKMVLGVRLLSSKNGKIEN